MPIIRQARSVKWLLERLNAITKSHIPNSMTFWRLGWSLTNTIISWLMLGKWMENYSEKDKLRTGMDSFWWWQADQ